MARLRWTPQALDDIEAICKFIARDSDHFAHLFANKLFEKAKSEVCAQDIALVLHM